MMILINGGSSSGKSAFAETLIVEQAKKEEVMAEAAGKARREKWLKYLAISMIPERIFCL